MLSTWTRAKASANGGEDVDPDANETGTRTCLIGVHELFERRVLAVDWSSVRDVHKVKVLVGLERMHSFPGRGDRSTSAEVQVRLDERRQSRICATAGSDSDSRATCVLLTGSPGTDMAVGSGVD